ncbi:MAG: hypothetical protein QOF15_1126 [Mycobacterium sp.]|jgi:hypothetical protein|nr:hypothetical protein [Mycobacterium sp.]
MSIEVSGQLAARACYLAEWYRPEFAEESLDHTVATIEACASTTASEISPVELVAMLVVPTDEVVFGIFIAESADVVVKACHQAGVPAQRLTAAFDARRR